jgi:LysM repeat protein
MKYKFLLVTAPLLACSYTLFAGIVKDSIGIENLNGKKVILHKLDPKDNFYSIARRYNVKPAAIIEFNKDAKMTIGNIIKVPTDRSFVENTTVKAVVPPPVKSNPQNAVNSGTSGSTTQYKVSAGETLYAISKRFGTTVDDIVQLNNLKSNTLTPGQVLVVREGTPAPKPPVVADAPVVVPTVTARKDTPSTIIKRDSTLVVNKVDSGERHNTNKHFGLNEKNEKGIATWIDDSSLDPNKKLVLHRTAPVGTVIKITNPMSNRTTFAKVVGRFNDSEATKDVIIVMTKNTAESLGALDKRFHVNISYGTPNE